MRKRYVCYLSDKRANLRAWLDQQPNRSAVMVTALEMYQAWQEGKTKSHQVGIEEIRQVFREELAQVSITNGTNRPDWAEGDEDEEIRQGIDALTGAWDFGDDESE